MTFRRMFQVPAFIVLALGLLWQPTEAQVDFDPAMNLSNTPPTMTVLSFSHLPAVASIGQKVYVVWEEERNEQIDPDTNHLTRKIHFRASTDGGETFGDGPSGKVIATVADVTCSTSIDPITGQPTTTCTSGPVDIPSSPPNEGGSTIFSLRMAAFQDNVYAVFTAGDVPTGPFGARAFFMRSMDGGATFSSPVDITPATTAADSGFHSGVDIAVDGSGVIHVVMEDIGGFPGGGSGDILYRRSVDGGANFSEAVSVATTGDPSFFPRVAAAGTNVAVVWHDTVGTGLASQGEVMVALSTDQGASFPTIPIQLTTSTDNSILPAVALGGQTLVDGIHVVWSEGGQALHARSTDGTTFTSQFLGFGFGPPGSIEVAASGSTVSVFTSATTFTRSTDGGQTFTPQQNLAMGLSGVPAGEPVGIEAGSPMKVVWVQALSPVPQDTDTFFRRETAAPAPVNNPPVALADGPYGGVVGFAVKMDASASSDPDNDALTYTWAFGDDSTTTTTDPIVSHIYTSTGIFPVILKVEDVEGASDTFTTDATILSQGFGGGGQSDDVDSFLTYIQPSERSTTLPTGTTAFKVMIVYGATIRPMTFKAVLNGVDITSSFTPSPGTSETVDIALSPGQRNVLLLTVDGELSSGRVATDRDRLTFVVP